MSNKIHDLDITIDDNNNIRILSADKYSASEKLKGESTKFVSSININNNIKKLCSLIV
jgi:hypothetical protein